MRGLMGLITLSILSVSAWGACKGDQNHTAYSVNKMHCADCVASITQYFSKQPAVASASVSLENKCMLIELKPGAKLSQAEVEAGLKKLGYELGKVN